MTVPDTRERSGTLSAYDAGMRGLPGYAAVVLAGGAGRRLGGPDKPALPVAGRPMLHRVLDAVAGARVTVVVGPPELSLPASVIRTREDPPGAGPVAATAAGLAALPGPDRPDDAPGPDRPDDATDPAQPRIEVVAVLAADLPLLTPRAIDALRRRLHAEPAVAGAAYLDESSSRQWLCGVWRVAALRDRLAKLGDPRDRALRSMLGELPVAWVAGSAGPAGAPATGVPPWFDCDTEADLRRAEELIHDRPE